MSTGSANIPTFPIRRVGNSFIFFCWILFAAAKFLGVTEGPKIGRDGAMAFFVLLGPGFS